MDEAGNLDGRFKGRRIFILGGGPSLQGFDFSRLEGEITIGVNNLIRYYTPTVLHWLDPETYFKNHELIDGFKGLKIASQVAKAKDTKGIVEIRTKNHPSRSFDSGGFYHSQSSGLTAFNIAVALGGDPIYLLGMDCCFADDGRSHFFDESHPRDEKPRIYEKFAGYWSKFSEWFTEGEEWKDDTPPKVFNCSSISRIKEFPFMDFEEIEGIPRKGKGTGSKRVVKPQVREQTRRLETYDGDTMPDCPVCGDGKGRPFNATMHISIWSKERRVYCVYKCRNQGCRHEFTLRASDVKDYIQGPDRNTSFLNTSKKWNGDHVDELYRGFPPPPERVGENGFVRVLDLGAGPALLAYRVKEAGADDLFKVVSVEASESCQRTANKVGLEITWGDVMDEEFLLSLGRFDLVYGSHILEHLPDPVRVLKKWRKLIAPGGKIFLEVPDADDVKVAKRFYEEDHLSYFRTSSLKIALKKAGYKHIQVSKPTSTEVSTNRSIIGGGVLRAWAEKAGK